MWASCQISTNAKINKDTVYPLDSHVHSQSHTAGEYWFYGLSKYRERVIWRCQIRSIYYPFLVSEAALAYILHALACLSHMSVWVRINDHTAVEKINKKSAPLNPPYPLRPLISKSTLWLPSFALTPCRPSLTPPPPPLSPPPLTSSPLTPPHPLPVYFFILSHLSLL